MAEKLEIEITADDKASGILGGVKEALSGVGSVAGGVLKAGVALGATAIIGLTTAIGGSIGPAGEAQLVDAQLDAVLRSTGGAAGMTKEAILGLSESLSQVTMFEDDAVTSAQNMLLTFTNIGSSVFPAATTAMLDMSQALGQDLKSSAIQLGKALNDPINGVTALQRVGVTFTEAQKEQIKAMVEAGDVAGAQALILRELQTEFGGSAVAAGQTFPGQLMILRNTLGNVAEGIGGVLLPILTNLASTLTATIGSPAAQAAIRGLGTALAQLFSGNVAAALGSLDAALLALFGMQRALQIKFMLTDIQDAAATVFAWFQTTIVPIIQQLATVIGTFVREHLQGLKGALGAIGLLLAGAAIVTGLIAVGSAIAALLNPVTLIIVAVGALGMAWAENWGGIRDKTKAVIDFLMPFIQGALSAIQGFWNDNGASILAGVQQVWTTIQDVISTVVTLVQTVVQTVWGAVTGFWTANQEQILSTAQTAWATIQLVISTVIDTLQSVIQTALAAIQGFWQEHGDAILGAVQTVWAMIQNSISTAISVIQAVLQTIMALIRGDWQGAWDGIKNIVAAIWEGIKTQVGLALDFLKQIIPAAWDAITGLTGAAWGAIQSVIGGVLSAIQGVVGAALGDVQGSISSAWSSIQGVTTAAWDAIRSVIAAVWTAIQSAIQMALGFILAVITGDFGRAREIAQAAWDAVRTVISGAWDGILTAVRGRVDDVRVAVGTTWNTIHGAAVSAWNAIKTAITTPIQEALGIIQGIINQIKGAWEGLGRIHIPLPHFRAGIKWASVAGIEFPIPDIGIEWYGRGLPATLFDQPTIIGVGERGPEVVTVTPAGSAPASATYSITYNDFRPVAGDAAVVEVLDRLAWKLSMGAA